MVRRIFCDRLFSDLLWSLQRKGVCQMLPRVERGMQLERGTMWETVH